MTFTDDYVDITEALNAARQAEKFALQNLDKATVILAVAGVMDIAGIAFHSLFGSGDEPKWRDDSQREDLIALSKALTALHRQIFPDQWAQRLGEESSEDKS